MRLVIDSLAENPVSLLRRAGYTFQREEAGEMSFIRPLARSGYPRFHCYTKLQKTSLLLHLHLDQKKHTYGNATRHHGEYDNKSTVKEEALRLIGIFGTKAKIS